MFDPGTILVAVDPLAFTAAVMAPGVVIVVVGVVLVVGRSVRGRAPSLWGLRLFYLGLGLLNLIPGLAIIGATLVGRLMWPAAFGGLVPICIGSGVLYGLRLWWADPAHGSLGGPTAP